VCDGKTAAPYEKAVFHAQKAPKNLYLGASCAQGMASTEKAVFHFSNFGECR
jgi:hypothetical protein